MSPQPPQTDPKTPERIKPAQPLSSTETTLVVITSDDDDDVRIVSKVTRRKRRKVLSEPGKTQNAPRARVRSVSSPGIRTSSSNPQSDATPTKRRRVPVTTPAILVTRSPSPQPPNNPSLPDPRPARYAPHPISPPAPAPPPPPPLPRKRRQPWNSRLFASLAQSLQHAFPFEEFAAKHERPVAEVLEVFSACVQIPLLMKSAEGLTNAKGAREAVKSFQDIRREAKEMLRGEQDDGITDESRMGEVIVVQETQCGK